MKKIRLVLFVIICLTACNFKSVEKDSGFPQAVLSKPETITVTWGDELKSFPPNDSNYVQIFEAIKTTWWQRVTNENDMLNNNMVLLKEPIKILNDFSDSDLNEKDILVTFVFAPPITWKNTYNLDNDPDYFNISQYTFIISPKTGKDFNKGILLISEDSNIFNKSNMYEYYYQTKLYESLTVFFNN